MKQPDAGTALLREDASLSWDPARFAVTRNPVPVARISDRAGFIAPLPRCLDMLVKLPGGDLALPESYRRHAGVRETMDACIPFEDALRPGWRENLFAYLTVDCRHVPEGRSHRNAGWHFDGMQGARYPVKLPACHQYVVADRLPTEFACGPFDASGLHETRHNWFAEIGRQADASAGRWRPRPFEIVAMSAYQVHRSVPAATGEAGWRMFLRFEVSAKRFDRLGNSVNPLLPAPWAFVPRPIPEGFEEAASIPLAPMGTG